MHISQNVGHKFLVVLIRRNCLKIVIYFHIYIHFFWGGEGGGVKARVCSPSKKGGVIFFDCQNLTVFSKTVKTGGISP